MRWLICCVLFVVVSDCCCVLVFVVACFVLSVYCGWLYAVRLCLWLLCVGCVCLFVVWCVGAVNCGCVARCALPFGLVMVLCPAWRVLFGLCVVVKCYWFVAWFIVACCWLLFVCCSVCGGVVRCLLYVVFCGS